MSRNGRQTLAVLAMLQKYPEGITALDALREAGSFRLAARIADLRESGHIIVADLVEHGDKRFARYRLVEA